MKNWIVFFVTTDLREHCVSLECVEKDIVRKVEELVTESGDELVDVIDWFEDEYVTA